MWSGISTRRRGRLVVAGLALALASGACGTVGAADSSPGKAEDPGDGAAAALESGTWELTEGTVDGRPVVVPVHHRITLNVDDGGYSGTAACNDYGGALEVRGDEVMFGEVTQTAMGCAAAVERAEERFLGSLDLVRSASVRSDVLELDGPDVRLRFERQAPVPIDQVVGTTWQLQTVCRAEGDRVSAVVDATLRLREDGTLAFTTGCQRATGEWLLDGDRVELTFFNQESRTDCSGRAAEQGRVVGDVLVDGFRATVDEQRLLVSSYGSELEYRAAGG